MKCNVEPLVIMDGGRDANRCKLVTVLTRVYDQMKSCSYVNANNQDNIRVFPQMGKEVFVSTLKQLGIKVIQADFEADEEITMIAKELDCYVLSNDSDFLVSNVSLVLLESLNYKNVQTEIDNELEKPFHYIPSHLFNGDTFCEVKLQQNFFHT